MRCFSCDYFEKNSRHAIGTIQRGGFLGVIDRPVTAPEIVYSIKNSWSVPYTRLWQHKACGIPQQEHISIQRTEL